VSRRPVIVAEAAQGYEGDPAIARLLVRAAAQAGADAIKFQIVFADDVAVPGYKYYDLFRDLEMPEAEWVSLRDFARSQGVRFYADVLGPRSADLAGRLALDGAKISTTSFYEDEIVGRVFATMPHILLSIGGIPLDDAAALLDRHGRPDAKGMTVLFGYQAEPTPTERNDLLRIRALREALGVDIGFMDHAEGTGPDTVTLSAMALALGVTIFEKHITLDRRLALEDHVSALPPDDFANYVASLRRLSGALGAESLALSAEEREYREKACKRVVAVRDLPAGTRLTADDLALRRPVEPAGLFRIEEAVGRTLRASVAQYAPVGPEAMA
jgi:sialic acid synthase SpsE